MLQPKISNILYEDFANSNKNSNNANEINNNYNSNTNSLLNDGLYSNGINVGQRIGGSSYEPDNKSISSTPSKISKFTYSGKSNYFFNTLKD